MPIIGRYREIKILDSILESNSAEFFAIYGRRRIGKTFLIREYFKKEKGVYFELTGRKDASKSLQLKTFATLYADVFNEHISIPSSWDNAFHQLKTKIETLPAKQKIIFFLDELPWLSSPKSGFLEALDFFWNHYISQDSRCILIVCGSAAEWMIKKIIANKAGLHNRLTRPPIQLMPLSLNETEDYLKARNVSIERKQIVDIYMAIGGVPYYLNMVPQGKSSAEVISTLFFSHAAALRSEFNYLLSSLYHNAEKHIAIIKVLATVRQGLTQNEIFQKTPNLSSGGGGVALLEELEHCGFILKVVEFGKKKKEARYRLVDAFSLFYLKWVKDVGETGENYWLRKMSSAPYYSWAGYAFENICFQHYPMIIKALELSVTAEAKSGWFLKGNDQEEGVQIDLLIDRSDKCINLCEIKFYEAEFVIDKKYAEILRRKKAAFREKSKTRKTLFLTMITAYGVAKNSLYLECVDHQLTMDALFLEGTIK
jgi:AAA+ ATPase superfamily predicted ATPase